VGACDAALAHKVVVQDVSRKIVHVAAGSWALFWPLFNEEHWTWQLNVAIPAVYSVQLFAKGFLFPDPNDPDVRTMSRSGKPIELCQGPLLFTLVMLYCGLYQFKTSAGVYIMGAVGYGDGIAPLVGKRFPFGKYPTFGGRNEFKTFAGSMTMFMFTILGIFALRAGIGAPALIDWVEILGVATSATVMEGLTGKWDNPAIPFAVLLALR